MINNIVLVGRTTKTIELKQNKNGTNYVQFTLAVNRPYKDEQGEPFEAYDNVGNSSEDDIPF